MHLHTSFATGRPHDPVLRGYAPLYRDNAANHCPGCGKSHWLVGRVTAQCAFCETALPLAHGYNFSSVASA